MSDNLYLRTLPCKTGVFRGVFGPEPTFWGHFGGKTGFLGKWGQICIMDWKGFFRPDRGKIVLFVIILAIFLITPTAGHIQQDNCCSWVQTYYGFPFPVWATEVQTICLEWIVECSYFGGEFLDFNYALNFMIALITAYIASCIILSINRRKKSAIGYRRFNMGLKEFLKPDKLKIGILVILYLIRFVVPLGISVRDMPPAVFQIYYSFMMALSWPVNIFENPYIMAHCPVMPPCLQTVSIIYFILAIVWFYILSCAILWLLRKKTTKSEEISETNVSVSATE